MIPFLIIDLREDTFATQAELLALVGERMEDIGQTFGQFIVGRIIITPHQEKMLKLELAENFVFRWKNLKNKHLDSIGNVPVVKMDIGEPVWRSG